MASFMPAEQQSECEPTIVHVCTILVEFMFKDYYLASMLYTKCVLQTDTPRRVG